MIKARANARIQGFMPRRATSSAAQPPARGVGPAAPRLEAAASVTASTWTPVAAGPRRAAWIVPTTHRPRLLRTTLESIVAQSAPERWDVDVVVVGEPGDAGELVAGDLGCRWVEAPDDYVGAKINAGLDAVDVDLVLVAGDDDIQDTRRLYLACTAYDAGSSWSSSGALRFRDVPTGRLALYTGPPSLVGTATSVARDVAFAVGGWPDVRRGIDGAMAARLVAEGYVCTDLGLDQTVALQHGGNLWPDRPFPAPGAVVTSGAFRVVGLSPDGSIPPAPDGGAGVEAGCRVPAAGGPPAVSLRAVDGTTWTPQRPGVDATGGTPAAARPGVVPWRPTRSSWRPASANS